jgi:hypothetical protein
MPAGNRVHAAVFAAVACNGIGFEAASTASCGGAPPYSPFFASANLATGQLKARSDGTWLTAADARAAFADTVYISGPPVFSVGTFTLSVSGLVIIPDDLGPISNSSPSGGHPFVVASMFSVGPERTSAAIVLDSSTLRAELFVNYSSICYQYDLSSGSCNASGAIDSRSTQDSSANATTFVDITPYAAWTGPGDAFEVTLLHRILGPVFPGAISSIPLSAELWTVANGSDGPGSVPYPGAPFPVSISSDFSGTAQLQIALGSGYTYSSESGVLLTSAVPAPPTIWSIAAALGSLSLHLRRRRRKTINDRGRRQLTANSNLTPQ